LVLFADDINIPIIDNYMDAVQASLNGVIKQFEIWFANNSCTIKIDKTKEILFHLNKTSNLVIPRIVLKMLKSVTHLKLSS
jgi:hypothetical protein